MASRRGQGIGAAAGDRRPDPGASREVQGLQRRRDQGGDDVRAEQVPHHAEPGRRGLRGKLKPEDDPKVLAAEGDRLMKLCNAYGVEQAKLVEKLADHDAIHGVREARRQEADQAAREPAVPLAGRLVPAVGQLRQAQARASHASLCSWHAADRPDEALVAMFEKKFAALSVHHEGLRLPRQAS